jgi:hypothetical protein
MTTFGILTTSLQFVGNEIRVLRVNLLARDAAKELGDVADSEASSKILSPASTKPETQVSNASSPILSNADAKNTISSPDTEATQSWLSRVGSLFSSLSPVTKISDEEYESQLNARRQQILDRLRQVNNDIANEESAQKLV